MRITKKKKHNRYALVYKLPAAHDEARPSYHLVKNTHFRRKWR